MRVAICLSGLVRTYRKTYENFCDALIKPNQHHEIDIFISTWPVEHSNNSMERTRRVAWYGDQTPPFPENPLDYHDIQAKYRPQFILIEKPKTFNVPWYVETPNCNIQSIMNMFYKIHSADLMRRQHERLEGWKYPAVIRTRFDTLIPFPIVLDEIDLSVITGPCMSELPPFEGRQWFNDKFAVGNSDNMSVYGDWYCHIENMVTKQGVPVQPETLLFHHLNAHGVKIVTWLRDIDMVRDF